MVFAYIRVSTGLQTVENQRLEIQKFAKKRELVVEEWVEETISSSLPAEKRQIAKLIDSMRAGDILIVSELSRMSRKLYELMDMLQKAILKNIKVISIKEGHEFGDNVTSKVLAFAFGLSAEIERSLISERTKAGLAKRKADGKILGRPIGAKTPPEHRKLAGKDGEIKKMLASKVSISAIARLCGVHRLTMTAYIEEKNLLEKAQKLINKTT
jgi:DNA invertase Pin-like site-specific DNA recombinase